jgi:hypothetical protein
VRPVLPELVSAAGKPRKCQQVFRKSLEPIPIRGYIITMAKTQPSTTEKIVRDSKSGRFVTVRGAGALKGQLTIKKGVDLTKPIAAQAVKRSKSSRHNSAHAKH